MRNREEIVFEKEDIDYLYWLSGSLAGSIQASQGDPQYLIDLPNIKWLLENAIAVDPNWQNGTLSAAMMSVYLNDLSGDKNAQKEMNVLFLIISIIIINSIIINSLVFVNIFF